jgi:Tol biopolymer transport system component
MRTLVTALAAAGSLVVPAFAAAPPGVIVFSRLVGDDRELYSIRPDGTGLTRLTDDAEDEGEPVLSPDRRLIASAGEEELLIRSASGQLVRRIAVPVEGAIGEPRWAPTGGWIAFLVERSDKDDNEDEDDAADATAALRPPADLWVARRDATVAQRLVAANVSTNDLVAAYAWSPNGRSLVFERLQRPALVVVDVPSRRSRVLSGTGRFASSDPSWARNGRIVFARQRGRFQGYDLFTIRADGKDLRRLARARSAARPTWSRDGRRVAFLDYRPAAGNRWLVTVVRANGRGRRQVGVATSDAALVWSPDGTRLLWQSRSNQIIVGRADGRGSPRVLTTGGVPDWR